jgi:hypothetical protein
MIGESVPTRDQLRVRLSPGHARSRTPEDTPMAAKPSRKTAQKSAPAKAPPKSEAKGDAATLNGIPLRRKSIWAVDTDSPQFRAARKRDAQALRDTTDDRDSMQFIDAVLADKDVQKWWN